MNLGPYAAFIVGAYAVAGTVIAGMIVWVWLDYRRQLRMLADLEAQQQNRMHDEQAKLDELKLKYTSSHPQVVMQMERVNMASRPAPERNPGGRAATAEPPRPSRPRRQYPRRPPRTPPISPPGWPNSAWMPAPRACPIPRWTRHWAGCTRCPTCWRTMSPSPNSP